MIRDFSLLIACLLMGATSASAQVSFDVKYADDSKVVSHRETKSTQTLTLAGMDIDTKSSTFIVATTKIGKRDSNGVIKLEEKADTVQSEISLPGGLRVQFDSANPEKKADIPQLEPLLEVFRAAYRLPVTVELDAMNKIVSAKLPDGEFEKLSETVKEHFESDALSKALKDAHGCLPDGQVKKGDTWERSSEANLGSGQLMTFRTIYEYAGTVEQDGKTLEKITGKVIDVNYSVKPNPSFQVTKSDLKVTESESTFLFDRDLGSVVKRTSKTRIAGPLTLVINGMELPGKVDLTIEDSAIRQK